MGAPVGEQSFIAAATHKLVQKAVDSLEKCKYLNDPQMELLLLRCCTGAPKMTFWQRTCDPNAIKGAIQYFDEKIDEALQHIVGIPVTGRDRATMHLPLSFGGLGIPIAGLSSEAAFVSSVGSSWHLQPGPVARKAFFPARLNLITSGSDIPELAVKDTTSVSPLLNQSDNILY